jgi:hypothetical protein
MKRFLLATLSAGLWIGANEFLRNELLFKSAWIEKYRSLGLRFPSSPVNNALWAVWGFLLAAVIVHLVRRRKLAETILIAWTLAFALMWIVIGNLGVLPFALLPVAVPWALFEVAGAAFIAARITRPAASPPP